MKWTPDEVQVIAVSIQLRSLQVNHYQGFILRCDKKQHGLRQFRSLEYFAFATYWQYEYHTTPQLDS